MRTTLPKFQKVYDVLKRQIDDGVYNVGDYIPTEPELEKLFGISRTTVRKVIGMLVNDGIVVPQQGKGTVVVDFKTVQRLNHVTSFSETLREKGYEVTSRDTAISRVIPPSHVASALKLGKDSKVIKIQRTRLINDKPIAISVNYLPEDIAPGIEEDRNELHSLYRLLEHKYKVYISSSQELISAKAAGFMEAEILQIEENAPLLVSKRITFSNDRPIEYVVTSIIAEKYEFCIYSFGR